ncbi:hypothetical protein [Streptomyces sp. CC219B]|uniref:hypothetical protein n=1 Tax=Streptomyces sp. CC219B TaxID=3044574 RepID=UPI0024A97741|nr:hypothetical protein [Streptomyces sp. CC219B]
MNAPQEASAPPTSYSLVLPPGWRQIPLRHGTESALKRILDQAFENLPRDEVFTYRRGLEGNLWQRVREARKADGLDLYLPVELMHGISVPASILVSETRMPSAEDVDPAELALFMASSGDGREVVDLDGAAAVRAERTEQADPDRGVQFPSRRVDYQVPVPGQPSRWLTVAFSTVGAEDVDGELSLLLVDLFDAVMTTFRWRSDDNTQSPRRDQSTRGTR